MSFTQSYKWDADWGNNHERESDEYRSIWDNDPEPPEQLHIEDYTFPARPLQTKEQREFNDLLKKQKYENNI